MTTKFLAECEFGCPNTYLKVMILKIQVGDFVEHRHKSETLYKKYTGFYRLSKGLRL